MATCNTNLPSPDLLTEFQPEATMDEWEMSLHDKLVAHTFSVTDDLEGRSGVWGEHSYARERGAATHTHVRTLLLPRTSQRASLPAAQEVLVDIETASSDMPALPLDDLSDTTGDSEPEPEEPEASDWEQSVVRAAPNPALRRLALTAIDVLKEMRLRRLVASREASASVSCSSRWERRETTRGAARRLRRVLAVLWTGSAGGPSWLHGALLPSLPRALRLLYGEVTAELHCTIPRLTDRLTTLLPPPSSPDPLDDVSQCVTEDAPGPWLGWVSVGCERLDTRWRRRLSALLHMRVLPATASSSAAAPPDRWCAARAHAARAALAQMLQEAGDRPVVLGGCGAGAALAAWLAQGGAGLRALLLLAPPLLTAEGPRDSPDDLLHELKMPMLLVVGGSAAQCWRGGAEQVAAGVEVEGETVTVERDLRRLLLVGGADDALRLPRRHRLRLRVPQQALDAAIADECARWAKHASERLVGARSAGGVERARNRRNIGSERTPSTAPSTSDPVSTTPGNRTIEIVEGCVVSRVAGSTPLALGPPRRTELLPADIMRLPIVFADDHVGALPSPQMHETSTSEERVTVRAGDATGSTAGGVRGTPVRYTRVIVAKRAGKTPLVMRRRLNADTEC